MDLLKRVAAAAERMPVSVDAAQRELAPPIDGVRLRRLHKHVDHRGFLLPLLDTAHDFWDEPVVYGYLISVAPGRVKGWGMHEHQTDRYVSIHGDVRVALFDGREDSPTAGASASVYFSDAAPAQLSIPPGVWHADQNFGTGEALVLNLPTRRYDPAAPDKLQIGVDAGVIPFDFSLRES